MARPVLADRRSHQADLCGPIRAAGRYGFGRTNMDIDGISPKVRSRLMIKWAVLESPRRVNRFQIQAADEWWPLSALNASPNLGRPK